MSSSIPNRSTDSVSFKLTFPSRKPLELLARAVRPDQSLVEAVQQLIAAQFKILAPRGEEIKVEQIDS